MNKGGTAHDFRVSLEPDDETGADHDGGSFRLDPAGAVFRVAPGEVFNAAVRVRREAWTDDDARAELHFTVTAVDDPALKARAEARFFAPKE
jgi:hypothetical protein